MRSGGVMIGDCVPLSTACFQLARYAGYASLPGTRRSLENAFWYVLMPSSIHAYRRSFEPTTMGNHWCPCSWSRVLKIDAGSLLPYETITNIGYSIPPTGPATDVDCGYGKRNQSCEYVLIDHRVCSAADSQARPAFGN